ncbi:4-hydroxy-tetrahydrodipicolinate reductase [Georgenia sp. Z1491]|uniref:4-hydroxy-tetrahydrodipicolinate reductase n=1 Tax=Georgenia sp. Z1491 TaxID=3416707 RepID=UPI003CEE2DC7
MSESIRVAVVGAAGRMGQQVVGAVRAAEDLELVAELDAGDDVAAGVREAGASVAVEFAVPSASRDNVRAILDAGASAVVGTTGWTDEALAELETYVSEVNERRADAGEEPLGVLVAPNFALSAVLAMSFARQAAAYFESVEVVELHHPDKVDAPSGTALSTARGIAAARREAGLADSPDATETDPDGARGANVDGVHVHAVRLRGLIAHEEVLLGNPGEQLTIRTDSFDRASFMPGVLLAARQIGGRPGLTRGLDALLDV